MKSFMQLMDQAKLNDSYWVEQAKLQFSVEFNRLFKRKGCTKKELAGHIQSTPAYITKVFRGDVNFTIETMVKLARSVDGELQIHIVTAQDKDAWNKVMSQYKPAYPEIGDVWLRAKENPHVRISSAA